jgi:hypothetical protein
VGLALACGTVWPVASAAQEDPCALLQSRLSAIAAEALKRLPADKQKELNSNNTPRHAVDDIVSKLAPFAAETHNAWLVDGSEASVTFDGNRFKQIKDADVSKVCVRVYALNAGVPAVSVERVSLIDKGQEKSLKVAFKVETPVRWYWPWANYDYLVFGLVTGSPAVAATPTAGATPAVPGSPAIEPVAFGHRATFTVAHYWTTAILSVLFVLFVYLGAAYVTYPRKKDATKSGEPKDAKHTEDPEAVEKPDEMKELAGGRRPLFFLSPVRITAAWFGEASMSQLQVVIFTLVVAGLMLNILLRTGSLTELSMDVLKLIGISALGSAGAKFTQTLKTALKSESARYLIGKGWYQWKLRPIENTANFRQLLLTDNRLDVYKLQMLIFTVIVALYILSAGQSSLEGVRISDAMIYLLGISQLVYVGGKAVTDRTTDLEEAVAKMRELEPKLKSASGTADEKKQWQAEYDKAEETAAEEFAFLQNRIRPDARTASTAAPRSGPESKPDPAPRTEPKPDPAPHTEPKPDPAPPPAGPERKLDPAGAARDPEL